MSRRKSDDRLERGLEEVGAALRERQRGEARLRESEERLRQFGDEASEILWIRDAETLQWEYLTAAFNDIYGAYREEALAGDNFASWIEFVVPEDRERVTLEIERIRRGERVSFEYRIRRPIDHEIRWLRDDDFPMRDDSGRVTHIGGIGHDITQRKLTDESRTALLAELQHHQRNSLSVIRSIVRQTVERSTDSEEAIAHIEGRINAFARIEAAITRSAATGIELAPIVAEELRVAGAREGDNLTIAGPALRLNPRAAETLGLAMHELATNALKYGALSSRSGCISVDWRVDHEVLHFSWTESGMQGLEPITRQGFGREVLERTLPYSLDATVSLRVEHSGFQFHAEIPLRSIAARSQGTGAD